MNVFTVQVEYQKRVIKSYFCCQDNVDLGDLMFSLCYLPTAGRLTITMIKARNLKAMDITGASGMSSHSDYRLDYRLV